MLEKTYVRKNIYVKKYMLEKIKRWKNEKMFVRINIYVYICTC